MQHHLLIIECPKTVDQVFYAKHHDQIFQCYDPEDPLKQIRAQCTKVILVHSILSNVPVTLDSKAGMTFDPEQMPYYLVELHLLNPSHHEVNVSVTLRLSMTSILQYLIQGPPWGRAGEKTQGN